jgi:hypothetical protein
MKGKPIYIWFVLWLLLFTWGCGLDSYKAPNAIIKGKLIDNISNKPLQTKQPDGFKIRLIEVNKKYENPTPIDFWGEADGMFKNTKLFADKYKVIPIEGAFFEPDTQTVNLREGSATTVNFKVTPFLEITNVSVTPISNEKKAIVKYQINKSPESGKILTSESLASLYPAVNHTVFDQRISHDLSNIPDDEIINSQFADTLSSLVADSSGGNIDKTYYIRVSAKTDNKNNKYNYSKTFKITLK